SDLFPHPEGEIRRYSFPALAIRCERELLEAQQAEDMKEILSNVSASVDAFASLMELMDAEAKVDGVIIHILGRELQRIGKILFKMQDTYSTVELVGA
ncbi:strubbelig protein, partial [Bilophila wadsworthia]